MTFDLDLDLDLGLTITIVILNDVLELWARSEYGYYPPPPAPTGYDVGPQAAPEAVAPGEGGKH